jgi:hypothetical protein
VLGRVDEVLFYERLDLSEQHDAGQCAVDDGFRGLIDALDAGERDDPDGRDDQYDDREAGCDAASDGPGAAVSLVFLRFNESCIGAIRFFLGNFFTGKPGWRAKCFRGERLVMSACENS